MPLLPLGFLPGNSREIGIFPGKSAFFPGTNSRETGPGIPRKIHTIKVRLLTDMNRNNTHFQAQFLRLYVQTST